MFAIVDCDNCFVSCERVFRPDLNGKPVVVLSNNDGCVVARSNEAKALGIKAGTPYFQLKDLFPGQEIAVFSSNYELYIDMTDRVMSLIRQEVPEFYRYSIDEGFCMLDGMNFLDLKEWGEKLHQTIKRCTGMPVSIGIAQTKTLAKMASHYAKKYPGFNHCCYIDNIERRNKALELYPIEEVWGIGRQYAKRLQAERVTTAYDFAMKPKSWVRATFNVVVERTWRELNGDDCVPLEDLGKKKSICTSRSFPGMVPDFETLRTSISNFAAHCAEKLRKQQSAASIVSVFIDTNHFREDLPQYWNWAQESLLTPTSSTQDIVQCALRCTQRIFRQGYQYKRAGVVVAGICPDTAVQTNFIDYDSERYEKKKRLDEAIDKINRMNGSETIVLGSQQYTAKDGKGKAGVFRDSIKHDFRSPSYTTKWSDIPEAK
ncbi:Y-family DNA polymerase [Prevotella communis]|uniref:Y-family DNA polymerase n=1 Tax=Prevotella communis TaxID=2913614 RepID=UPI001EDB5935|nr:Y-family DNA polymerase [Prevotella communis]UKK63299.1 Y-family DNA polymerase [Prevotella communis]UKK66124.1 Y-family DNA polymerase [Prevotella communis]